MTTLQQESRTFSNRRLYSHSDSHPSSFMFLPRGALPDWSSSHYCHSPKTSGIGLFSPFIWQLVIPFYISSLIMSFSFLCISALHPQLTVSSSRQWTWIKLLWSLIKSQSYGWRHKRCLVYVCNVKQLIGDWAAGRHGEPTDDSEEQPGSIGCGLWSYSPTRLLEGSVT